MDKRGVMRPIRQPNTRMTFLWHEQVKRGDIQTRGYFSQVTAMFVTRTKNGFLHDIMLNRITDDSTLYILNDRVTAKIIEQ